MSNIGADRGSLARVPADLVAAAIAKMASPETARSKLETTIIKVAGRANFRVTCVLRRGPRMGKRYWSVLRADPL
jgi:hypothetical protein